METLGTFIDKISAFTTWPLGATDWVGALLRTAVVFVAYWLAWMILRGIYREISRKYYVLHNRKRCVHCDKHTLKRCNRTDASCQPGDACCAACQFEHQLELEPARYCMHGDRYIPMAVSRNYRLIRHICPECNSVTMAAADYRALEQYWYNEGERKAEPAFWGMFLGALYGWNLGFVTGMSSGDGD